MADTDTNKLISLRAALERPDDLDDRAWLYLPATERWHLDSQCAVLISDEVPPELEDDPDAGVPEFAKRLSLMQALPVSSVKEVVRNARLQKEDVGLPVLFAAFLYFYDHDAFIEL